MGDIRNVSLENLLKPFLVLVGKKPVKQIQKGRPQDIVPAFFYSGGCYELNIAPV